MKNFFRRRRSLSCEPNGNDQEENVQQANDNQSHAHINSHASGHASLRRRIPRSRTTEAFRRENNLNNQIVYKTDWSYCRRPPRPLSEVGRNHVNPAFFEHQYREKSSHSFKVAAEFGDDEDEEENEDNEDIPRPVLRPLSHSNSFTAFENNKARVVAKVGN